MYKIGQMVVYNTTSDERDGFSRSPNCNEQKQLPAMIVAVLGDSDLSAVNLKVFKDGEGDLWVTSAMKGDGEREFQLIGNVPEQEAPAQTEQA
jgi:hypothetical protein